MIDDAFLRHVAALQANLKMLESQSDALSDLADMKELRLYKSRLTEYIQAHTKAGNLPEDPFQVIAQRLEPISKFFTEAKEECKRLTDWKADWLKSVPAVSLVDLQSAKTELSEIVASVPQVQEHLRGDLSSIDSKTTPSMVDIYPELMACAQCLTNLQIPYQMQVRCRLYDFAQNEGYLSEKISTHIAAMSSRIDMLLTLHGEHVRAINEADKHLENHDFKKAQKIIESIQKCRFSDVDYASIESRHKTLQSLLEYFKNLESRIDERLKQGRLKEISEKIHQLRILITKPDSELGSECTVLLSRMETCFSNANKRRKNMILFLIVCLILIMAMSFGVIWEALQITLKE